jgi:hypothetical protein
MILKVVCKKDFFIPYFNSKKNFIRGKSYEYKLDKLENLCDEQIHHVIDDFPVPYIQFKENFSLIEDWRDDQINNLI